MFEFDTPDTPLDIPNTVGIEFLGLFAMILILSRLERFGLPVFCSKLYFLSAFSFHRLKQFQRKYPSFLQKRSFKVFILNQILHSLPKQDPRSLQQHFLFFVAPLLSLKIPVDQSCGFENNDFLVTHVDSCQHLVEYSLSSTVDHFKDFKNTM